MKIPSLISLLMAIAIGCCTSLCAQAVLIDRVVAWVNDEAITLSELEQELVRYQSSGRVSSQLIDSATLREALELWIDETLIIQAATKAGLSIPAETVDNRVDAIVRSMQEVQGTPGALDAVLADAGKDLPSLRAMLRDQVRRELTVARAVAARVTVTDADVERFEQDRRAQGRPTDTYYLYQLFFPVTERALPERWTAVIDKAHAARRESLETGSFRAVAEKWAEANRSSGASAGSLGGLALNELQPELREPVSALREGETAPPVRSDRGVHLLYLERKLDSRQRLYSQRFEEEKQRWARALRNEANIQIGL